MIDFTLKSYGCYIGYIKKQYNCILTFTDFFSLIQPIVRFCILRHDVDRKPKNALAMAKLEHDLGVSATYFFRTKDHVLNKKVISEIYQLGHEVGYHYESLADQKGDMDAALKDFELNLKKLRDIVPIHTISMHGRPLSRFDSRDIWMEKKNHTILLSRYGIKGEVYLDIDYSHIAYINDTGRTWCSHTSNIRDWVDTDIQLDLCGQKDLIAYLKKPSSKLVLSIHPERWHNDFYGYSFELLRDKLINWIKCFI